MFSKDDIKALVYAGIFIAAVYGSIYGFYYLSKFLGIYEQFKI
jgi:hypothetical protein